MDLLFALCVEVDPADSALNLVETYVVEPFEAGTTDSSYSVVRDQEMFFPSHEYILSLSQLGNMHLAFPSLLLEWSEGRKFSPML